MQGFIKEGKGGQGTLSSPIINSLPPPNDQRPKMVNLKYLPPIPPPKTNKQTSITN